MMIRDWMLLLTIVAVTSLIPSILVGGLAIAGIGGIIAYRAVRRILLQRAEQRALDRAVRRWTDLQPEKFPKSFDDRKVISLGDRRKRLG